MVCTIDPEQRHPKLQNYTFTILCTTIDKHKVLGLYEF